MAEHDVVIVAAKRTPMGSLLGSLSTLTAPELGAAANKAVLEQIQLEPNQLDEVLGGCVLSAGLGQAPARQASIFAGIPSSVGATTINKMCGSGMKAVMIAYHSIRSNPEKIILAGGMESMSNAPYLTAKARKGLRLGHSILTDHMFMDGLEDAYHKGQLMGTFAETTAEQFNFTREMQDKFASESMSKALNAIENGFFSNEITPITINHKAAAVTYLKDESPDRNKLAKIAHLKPAFSSTGTVTAANSSSISDGAASLILMSAAKAHEYGFTPLARIVAEASYAGAPEWFTTAPIEAIRRVMSQANWHQNDVDLFEINEAFAVVVLAAIQELNLDPAKVNIHGGACALGHPIGASGARILVTLLYALKHRGKTRGIAALCIGGGEATAVAIELL